MGRTAGGLRRTAGKSGREARVGAARWDQPRPLRARGRPRACPCSDPGCAACPQRRRGLYRRVALARYRGAPGHARNRCGYGVALVADAAPRPRLTRAPTARPTSTHCSSTSTDCSTHEHRLLVHEHRSLVHEHPLLDDEHRSLVYEHRLLDPRAPIARPRAPIARPRAPTARRRAPIARPTSTDCSSYEHRLLVLRAPIARPTSTDCSSTSTGRPPRRPCSRSTLTSD